MTKTGRYRRRQDDGYSDLDCSDSSNGAGIKPANIKPTMIKPTNTGPANIQPALIEPAFNAPAFYGPAFIEPAFTRLDLTAPPFTETPSLEFSFTDAALTAPANIDPPSSTRKEKAHSDTGIASNKLTHPPKTPSSQSILSADKIKAMGQSPEGFALLEELRACRRENASLKFTIDGLEATVTSLTQELEENKALFSTLWAKREGELEEGMIKIPREKLDQVRSQMHAALENLKDTAE